MLDYIEKLLIFHDMESVKSPSKRGALKISNFFLALSVSYVMILYY